MILERNYLDVYKVHTPVAVAVVVVVFCCRHAFIVVVILYVARYLMTVNAREHGGERRQCRLASHFALLLFSRAV